MYGKPSHRLWQTLSMGRKKFYKEFWALRDINFEVKRGECVGIIGRNGSGKSTLLQIIAGTLNPTIGNVEVYGRVAALLELGSGFNPEFTGRENVYMNATILGLTKAEIDAKYDEIVAFADIGEFIDQPVKTYSSGMYVRLAFAVAINVDPDILIVDEALSVGDVGFQRKCSEKIDSMCQRGVSIFFSSHDLHIVERLCSHALFLSKGICLLNGESKAVVAFYQDLINRESTKERDLAVHQSVEFVNSTKEIEFLGVEIFSERGEEKVSFVTHETINIRIRYRVLKKITTAHSGVSFWAGKEVRVGQAHSIFSSDRPLAEGLCGDFAVECKIPRNQLMPGRYFLRGGIYDQNVRFPYCVWGWTGNPTGEFFIVGTAINGFLLKDSLGHSLIDSAWRVIN